MCDYMEMETTEKKGLTTGQKLLIAGGTVAAGVIGFKFGKAWQGVLVESGLEKLLIAGGPNFEEPYVGNYRKSSGFERYGKLNRFERAC